MSKTKKKDENKVEKAMPKEDAIQAPPPNSSFASSEESKKKKPSPLDVMLYQAAKLKSIDEKLAILVGNNKSVTTAEVSEAKVPAKIEMTASSAAGESMAVSEAESKPIENLKIMFPEDLENLLAFEAKEDYIMIKPRQFLGSDNFAKIGAIIRAVGGDYVSAGKQSHFRVDISKLGEAKPVEQSKQAQLAPKAETKSLSRLEEIKSAFPEDLWTLLRVDTEKSASMILLYPKQFLGSDNFAKIAGIVRNLGGTYNSQGKESHFAFAKTPTK